MEPQMFALVDADDELSIYALGIDTGEEAFTFRRDPDTNKHHFSLHTDATAAAAFANRMTGDLVDLKLVRYEEVAALSQALLQP